VGAFVFYFFVFDWYRCYLRRKKKLLQKRCFSAEVGPFILFHPSSFLYSEGYLDLATGTFLVAYAFSAAPTALGQLSWDVCTTDEWVLGFFQFLAFLLSNNFHFVCWIESVWCDYMNLTQCRNCVRLRCCLLILFDGLRNGHWAVRACISFIPSVEKWTGQCTLLDWRIAPACLGSGFLILLNCLSGVHWIGPADELN